MYTKCSVAVMIVAGSIASASFAQAPMGSRHNPVTIPVRPEPSFEPIGPPTFEIDPKKQTAPRDDALLSQVYDRLPKLMTNRASVTRRREEPIVSEGKQYRRVWLMYEDSAAITMHGPCGQNIFVWRIPSGEVDEIYVGTMMCPLVIRPRGLP